MQWKTAVRRSLIAFVVLRLIASTGAWLAVTQMSVGDTVAVPGYSPPAYDGIGELMLEPWLRSDALWYLKAASVGYVDRATMAFFPAFPLTVRALTWMVGDELVAALVVSNLAALVGLLLAYRLFEQIRGEAPARFGVWAIALVPTSFFLVAPYAESFLLALGSAALLLARRQRWAASAACAAAAALSRPFGVLLVIPLIALSRGRHGIKRWAPPFGAMTAIASWAIFTAAKTGDLLAIVRVQQLWQREPSLFLVTIWRGIRAVPAYAGTGYSGYMAMDLAALVLAVVLVGAFARKALRGGDLFDRSLALYGAAAIVLPLSSVFPGRPLLSFPRFLLGLFPCAPVGSPPRVVRWGLGLAGGFGLLLATVLYVAARPLY